MLKMSSLMLTGFLLKANRNQNQKFQHRVSQPFKTNDIKSPEGATNVNGKNGLSAPRVEGSRLFNILIAPAGSNGRKQVVPFEMAPLLNINRVFGICFFTALTTSAVR